MNNSKVKELAEEYARFQQVNEEEVDMMDHIRLYESLVKKIEKAGLTFYDISKYMHLASAN